MTYSYKTKDTHKNLEWEDIGAEIERLFSLGASAGELIAASGNLIFERHRSGTERLKEQPPTESAAPIGGHDRKKEYLVDSTARYLQLLEITDRHGKVRREKNDKFRQVCKFIEVIKSLLDELPAEEMIRSVVDIGSGKSYLTFALYDYLTARSAGPVLVRGVEVRQELVDTCNAIARECGFRGLAFEHGAGREVEAVPVDMVVALHACDTATDDAILYALQGKARILVAAPCCHKYVRRSLVMPRNLNPVLGHGILEGRLADSLTDGLRALFLKAHGYRVKVFEFISPEHTAKNTMITAVRRGKSGVVEPEALREIAVVKSEFGLSDFYLDSEAFRLR
jgi:hypothetical protein